MAALVATAGVGKWAVSSSLEGFQGKEERIQMIPSLPHCSKATEDCGSTGCCQVSGHTCFTKQNGMAQCNETCTPGLMGFTCGVHPAASHSVPVDHRLGQRLYCFSVYVADTGSPEPSTELELLTLQSKNWVSIFACEQWDVFADVAVPIGRTGYTTIKVQDEFNEFHQLKREETGSWVNWALFYQVWKKVRAVGKWETADYTVKVDPDAVFTPWKLRNYLASRQKGESPHGLYFENCKNVKYGFFGNLEVISRTGTQVLTKYLENCHAEFAPCANDGCDWEYGPWGEDVFAQRCMDHHYVDKVPAYDMTMDGACEADRPADKKKDKKWHAEDCSTLTTVAVHPFKKPSEYLKCLNQFEKKTYTM